MTSKEANGHWLEWFEDPTTPISRPVHESRDRGHWWMRNQTGKCNFLLGIGLSIFIFLEIRHKKGPDKPGEGSAHRSTAKCENYCSCVSLIYIFFLFVFFLLNYLQALNKQLYEKFGNLEWYKSIYKFNDVQLLAIIFRFLSRVILNSSIWR